MSRSALAVALGAVVLVVGLLWWQGRSRDNDVRFEQIARAAEDTIAVLRPQLDSAKAAAGSADVLRRAAEARAQEAEERARGAEMRASLAAAARRSLMERIEATSVPEEARPFTDTRDAVIVLLESEVVALREAGGQKDEALAQKDLALREGAAVEGSLRTALVIAERSLAVALDALGERPMRRRWIPKLTLGYAGIVEIANMSVHHGPGVSIGWEASW